MRKFLLAGAALLSIAATPASALSLTFQSGSTDPNSDFVQTTNNPYYGLSNGLTVDFGAGGGNPGANPSGGVFTDIAGNPNGTSGVYTAELTSGIAAQPNFGSSGGFASVVTGGQYDISFAAASVFSFILGSLDDGNSLTLFNGATQVAQFTGAQLNAFTVDPDGNQSVGTQNGRVIIDGAGTTQFTRAVFSSTNNSFEFDNIITSVPEPGTWGMMILGFGLAGGALRSRRRNGLVIA